MKHVQLTSKGTDDMGDQADNLVDVVEVLMNEDFETLTKEQMIPVLRKHVQKLKKKDELYQIMEKLSISEEKLKASQENNIKTSLAASFYKYIAIGLVILVPLLLLYINKQLEQERNNFNIKLDQEQKNFEVKLYAEVEKSKRISHEQCDTKMKNAELSYNQRTEVYRGIYIAECKSRLEQEQSNFNTQLVQERNNFNTKLDQEQKNFEVMLDAKVENSKRTSNEQCETKMKNVELSCNERVELCINQMKLMSKTAEDYRREWDEMRETAEDYRRECYKMRNNNENRGFFSKLFTFIADIADIVLGFGRFGSLIAEE